MAGTDLEKDTPEKRVIDVYPVKKGRRMLIFLADFFLTLIAGIFIFNVAVYPLTRVATGYRQKAETVENYERQRLDILYANNLLFYDEGEKYIFNANLETTSLRLTSYYVMGTGLENEVLHTYYSGIKQMNQTEILEIYRAKDSYYEFLDFEKTDKNGLPTLKAEYAEEFKALFDEKDDLNSKGEADYDRFNRYFFLGVYGEIMTDISANGLSHPSVGKDYNTLTALIEEIWSSDDKTIEIAAIIAFVLTVVIFNLIIPLTNRRGKTVGYLILKEEKVQNNTLRYTTKVERIVNFAYQLVFQLPALMFLPFPTISFAYLFNLGGIMIVSLIGIVLILVSLIFLFVSPFNQTLSDWMTKTITVDTTDIDALYKQKGYLK